jgi:hypothetical protein
MMTFISLLGEMARHLVQDMGITAQGAGRQTFREGFLHRMSKHIFLRLRKGLDS